MARSAEEQDINGATIQLFIYMTLLNFAST